MRSDWSGTTVVVDRCGGVGQLAAPDALLALGVLVVSGTKSAWTLLLRRGPSGLLSPAIESTDAERALRSTLRSTTTRPFSGEFSGSVIPIW